jgi:hypothetical protein
MKKSKANIREEKEVAKLRKHWGLPPIKTGKINCLDCGKPFFSKDNTNERICEDCKYRESRR